MPKINVYSDRDLPFLRMPDGQEYYPPESDQYQQQGGQWLVRAAIVGWQKNSHLELGVVSINNADSEKRYDGIFMNLDRKASNDLIRALQTGRNGAFGKDA